MDWLGPYVHEEDWNEDETSVHQSIWGEASSLMDWWVKGFEYNSKFACDQNFDVGLNENSQYLVHFNQVSPPASLQFPQEKFLCTIYSYNDDDLDN